METLKDLLVHTGKLVSGIIGRSRIIDKIEVYGYINTINDDVLLELALQNQVPFELINKDPVGQIVLSNHIMQYSNQAHNKKIVLPIFDSVSQSSEERSYDIVNLYVPCIYTNQLYRKIKYRHKKMPFIYECDLKRNGFPENIHAEEGHAVLTTKPGDLLCYDRDSEVRSVGEHIMAVCRYVHAETGRICYVQYDLDEIFVDHGTDD